MTSHSGSGSQSPVGAGGVFPFAPLASSAGSSHSAVAGKAAATGQGSSAPTAGRGGSSAIPLPSSLGPLTVVNPEQRARAGGVVSADAAANVPPLRAFGPESDLCRLLFPTEYPGEIAPEATLTGLVLDHFEIQERIGIGGMGTVFRALDTRLQRMVALKVLSPSQSRDASSVQRFQNEAQAAARLDHDNIARVYYIGEDRGLHFIAFEFVTGVNIRDQIRASGRMEPEEAVNYALQIASALRHTAAAGVVHRDIKPSNIIIAATGRAKLVDLGLARKVSPGQEGELTIAGTTLGTFDYISPEQARDPRNVDVRSDIYSLGCTLYHMLAGEAPYPDGTVLQKLLDHQGGDSPDPARKNRRVPPNLSAVVQKMMASDPRRRYATPDDLIRDLMLVAGGLGMRGMNPEGLIWAASKTRSARFWEKNLGWMLTASLLLMTVIALDRYPWLSNRLGGSPSTATNDARGSAGDRRPPMHPGDSGPSLAGGSWTESDVFPGDTTGERPGTTVGTRPVGVPSALSGTRPGNPLLNTDGDEKATASDGSTFPRTLFNDPSLPLVAGSTIPPDLPSGVGDFPKGTNGGGSRETGTRETSPGDSTSRKPEGSGSPNGSRPIGPAAIASRDGSTGGSSATDTDTVRPGGSTGGSSGKGNDSATGVAATAPGTGSSSPSSPTRRTEPGESPGETRPSTAEVRPQPLIAILSQTGGDPRGFPTLEAACAEADDGSIIEVRYNGPRSETDKPLRIANKKVTIRAGKGFRPVIDFAPRDLPSSQAGMRMIAVSNGSLELHQIDVRLTISESLITRDGNNWSLFALTGAEQLRLQGVQVTVVNPASRPVAVVDVAASAGMTMPKMKMMPNGVSVDRPKFDVKITESFLRGSCDLLLVRATGPGTFDLEKSAFVIDGAGLLLAGGSEMANAGSDLRLRIDHVTGVVGSGIVRVDSGEVPREVIPIHVEARNNIFASRTAMPLVSMAGATSADDFRRLLRWHGEKNFYDRFESYWTITTPQGVTDFDSLDFDGWKRVWSATAETADVGASRSGVRWIGRWIDKLPREATPADLELDDAATGGAVGGATDGSDAGADLSKLIAAETAAP